MRQHKPKHAFLLGERLRVKAIGDMLQLSYLDVNPVSSQTQGSNLVNISSPAVQQCAGQDAQRRVDENQIQPISNSALNHPEQAIIKVDKHEFENRGAVG
jgi:hypothetical protein